MDEKLRELAMIKLNANVGRREERLQMTVANIQSEALKQGVLKSSGTFQLVEQACVQEAREQVEEAWNVFRDVMEKLGIPVDSGLADEIKSEIRNSMYAFQTKLNMLLWAIPGIDLASIESRKNVPWIMEERLKEISAEIDLYDASSSSVRTQQTAKQKAIFLSHAASDAEIAMFLKNEIEHLSSGTTVFCSSDPTDLPPGTKWSPQIQLALQSSNILIVLVSERSLQRPWVWFECGTFWFSGRYIMPVCLGAVRKNGLPPPLSELQAINADDPYDLKVGFERLAKVTGGPAFDAKDFAPIAERLKQLDRSANEALAVSTGWLGAEWNGNFLAYDGPYQRLPLIEDAVFQSSMQTALSSAGYRIALYDQNHFATMGDFGRFVQLTDRKSWRCRISQGPMWLVAHRAS